VGCEGRVEDALRDRERRLAIRLKRWDDDGVIGGRAHRNIAAQPPSVIYWTALGTWGILRRLSDDSLPTRRMLHRYLGTRRGVSRLKDDDDSLLEGNRDFFVGLPDPPTDWTDHSAPLTFSLTAAERRFLRTQLLTVRKRDTPHALSLLARLAQEVTRKEGSVPETMTSSTVLRLADESDVSAIRRAEQAAQLSWIGRAVYAALAEQMLEDDGVDHVSSKHRDHLRDVRREARDTSLTLSLDELWVDLPGLPEHFRQVLLRTQAWLKTNHPVTELHDVYAHAEIQRKGRRARLATTIAGRDRRQEWAPEEQRLAEPLHYRWPNVQRLLIDLRGQP